MQIPQQIIAQVRAEPLKPVSAAVHALSDEILARYGNAARAVLFYGSCLRSGDATESIVDLYLLVSSYRRAYGRLMPAFWNKLLPPNVFYLEMPFQGRIVRAKYAVISLTDFEHGTSRRWFHCYLWGRFAQPAALLYASTPQVASRVQTALAQSVVTFIARTLPRMRGNFAPRQLWQRGLELSYRAELRAERPEKLGRLFEAASQYYEKLTHTALASLPLPVERIPGATPVCYRTRLSTAKHLLNRLAWVMRTLQGKLLSVLRLFKALFTFKGGLDYVLWKIERHSGVRVEVAPRLKRYPLLAAGVVFWRLYRRGAFR